MKGLRSKLTQQRKSALRSLSREETIARLAQSGAPPTPLIGRVKQEKFPIGPPALPAFIIDASVVDLLISDGIYVSSCVLYGPSQLRHSWRLVQGRWEKLLPKGQHHHLPAAAAIKRYKEKKRRKVGVFGVIPPPLLLLASVQLSPD